MLRRKCLISFLFLAMLTTAIDVQAQGLFRWRRSAARAQPCPVSCRSSTVYCLPNHGSTVQPATPLASVLPNVEVPEKWGPPYQVAYTFGCNDIPDMTTGESLVNCAEALVDAVNQAIQKCPDHEPWGHICPGDCPDGCPEPNYMFAFARSTNAGTVRYKARITACFCDGELREIVGVSDDACKAQQNANKILTLSMKLYGPIRWHCCKPIQCTSN